jgi:hypothetical protein
MFFKVANSYDLYDFLDKGSQQEIVDEIASEKGFPDFIVKTSSECIFPSDKTDDCFALVAKESNEKYRKFPIDNKIDAWFSQEVFKKTAYDLPIICRGKVANNIKKACSYFDLEVDPWLEKVAESDVKLFGVPCNFVDFDHPEIQAIETDFISKRAYEGKFALPSIEKYPLNTFLEVKTACSFFEKNYDGLKSDFNHEEFAENLKEACDFHSIPASDLLLDTISDKGCLSSDCLSMHLDSRIKKAEELEFPSNVIGDLKLSYTNIRENLPFLKKQDVFEQIKKADDHFFKFETYRNVMSPEAIVKHAADVYVEQEKSAPINADQTNGDSYKKDLKLMAEKITKNPTCLRGYFSENIIASLLKDFVGTYNSMSKLDKEAVDKIYDKISISGE